MLSREGKIVSGVFVFSIALWLIDIAFAYKLDDWSIWLLRKELINLTGIIAIVSMGIIMIIAIRPKFLEHFFQGMDKAYFVHKWLGIIGISAAILHYGIKLSKPLLKTMFEQGAKIPRGSSAFLADYTSSAKLTGEILFYIFAAMLLITLLKKIPYRVWFFLHKIMGLLFAAVVFHTIVLAPARYWFEPVGLVLALLSLIGLYAAALSLFGLIGKKSKYSGEIINLEMHKDVTIVSCKVPANWHHNSGQYAFVSHKKSGNNRSNHNNNYHQSSEAHPFTIASTEHAGTIRFAIKSLGDYTSQIPKNWAKGDQLEIEGPYGRFSFIDSPFKKQIWIAGGVGITPFISWLESFQENLEYQKLIKNSDITLYYCVSSFQDALMPDYLQSLAARAGIKFHIHCSDKEGFLDARSLNMDDKTGVWFCGPQRFARSLQNMIKKLNLPLYKHFHTEYFDMR